jgi:thymidine phosphorylase
VMQVLSNEPQAPADLREKALRLAGRVLEFDAAVRGGEGYALARRILESGRALAKMDAIIEAQGRALMPAAARLRHRVIAERPGFVTAIDCERIARIARLAGAPKARSAGVDLHRKLGDRVERGEPLYEILADTASELAFAQEVAERATGFAIADEPAANLLEP